MSNNYIFGNIGAGQIPPQFKIWLDPAEAEEFLKVEDEIPGPAAFAMLNGNGDGLVLEGTPNGILEYARTLYEFVLKELGNGD